ncbi:hypothetical protein EJB05_03276 [Eragrostis curvula]|uniref:Uncharacterized protein n=1 Tax=Eragrostis curvula TaxID=38414 RepID=A0A5J9WKV5_9POAL|nr:hypothetical protein EJB05_03276 [Eragrostis curvula]
MACTYGRTALVKIWTSLSDRRSSLLAQSRYAYQISTYLTENGGTKHNPRRPTDEGLKSQVYALFFKLN